MNCIDSKWMIVVKMPSNPRLPAANGSIEYTSLCYCLGSESIDRLSERGVLTSLWSFPPLFAFSFPSVLLRCVAVPCVCSSSTVFLLLYTTCHKNNVHLEQLHQRKYVWQWPVNDAGKRIQVHLGHLTNQPHRSLSLLQIEERYAFLYQLKLHWF